jgi:hypothetical protein
MNNDDTGEARAAPRRDQDRSTTTAAAVLTKDGQPSTRHRFSGPSRRELFIWQIVATTCKSTERQVIHLHHPDRNRRTLTNKKTKENIMKEAILNNKKAVELSRFRGRRKGR